MLTTTEAQDAPTASPGLQSFEPRDYEQYRALSSLAVAGAVLGVVGLLALLDWFLALIPLVGIVVSLLALRRIRTSDGELTGRPAALTGLVLNLLLLPGALGLHTYVYLTEVPPGYQRVSYSELQPDDSNPVLPPAPAAALEGRQIFIKGYILPGAQDVNLTHFILVRDNGACCFGAAEPKLTDKIEVRLTGELSLDYTTRQVKLAGTFHVEPAHVDGGRAVIYHLLADYAK